MWCLDRKVWRVKCEERGLETWQLGVVVAEVVKNTVRSPGVYSCLVRALVCRLPLSVPANLVTINVYVVLLTFYSWMS